MQRLATLRLPRPFQATSSHNAWRRRSQLSGVVASTAWPGRADMPAALTRLSRRQLQAAVLAAVLAAQPSAVQAFGFKKKELKKRKILPEDYAELAVEPRLRYYDLEQGGGAEAKEGSRVMVHFECKYRGLYVVSTRSARTLGGNRTVAEPFEFVVGQPVMGPKGRMVESAGGLYAGSGGPTPPLALALAVVGMRVGGKRSILVPAELGYGSRGEQEIPPNCDSFDLQVDLLSIA